MVGATKIVAWGVTAALMLLTNKDPEFRILDEETGYNSATLEARVTMATTKEGWDVIYEGHKGTHGAPLTNSNVRIADPRAPINFEQNFVLVVFGGRMADTDGFEIVNTDASESEALVRLRRKTFYIDPKGPRVSQPYAFYMLPKSHRKVYIELLDDFGRWQRIGELPPTLVDKSTKKPAKKTGN